MAKFYGLLGDVTKTIIEKSFSKKSSSNSKIGTAVAKSNNVVSTTKKKEATSLAVDNTKATGLTSIAKQQNSSKQDLLHSTNTKSLVSIKSKHSSLTEPKKLVLATSHGKSINKNNSPTISKDLTAKNKKARRLKPFRLFYSQNHTLKSSLDPHKSYKQNPVTCR